MSVELPLKEPEFLAPHSLGFSSATISITTGPDQSHFGQEMIPVAIARRSISSKLTTNPHLGHVCTLSQCFLPTPSGDSRLIALSLKRTGLAIHS